MITMFHELPSIDPFGVEKYFRVDVTFTGQILGGFHWEWKKAFSKMKFLEDYNWADYNDRSRGHLKMVV